MERFRFPMFIDITGKRTVIIGAGEVALRRAEVLLMFGADVHIYSPETKYQVEGVSWHQRPYETGDLEGAVLAVAATNSRQVNRAVGEEARRLGIPVSVADRRDECTFFFPAVCTGGGIVAGLVSDGNEHKKVAEAAKEIRRLLEVMK